MLDLPLETFNTAVEQIAEIVRAESGSEAEEKEPVKVEGKRAWALATRLLRRGRTPPPSMR